jgi:integrase
MGELAEEDRRPSTRRVYRSKWRGFARFCEERDTEPLPASPEMVGNYLSKRAEEVSLSTIRQDVAAIRWMHERRGAGDPTDHAGVSRILDGINQTSDTVPEKKQAVLTKHVRAMVKTLSLEEPSPEAGPAAVARHLRALRNRVIILIGYAGAFRRAELARIRAGDIGFNADGMEVHVPQSKTEPRTVGINFARSAEFCPVRTLREWTGAAGIEEGPIFRAVPRSAEIAPDEEANPVTGKTIRNVIGDAAEAAGLDRETVSGHSLRRGHLTQGALNGAELNRLMKQAGHSDPRTTAGYVEDAKRMETNTSRDLGL